MSMTIKKLKEIIANLSDNTIVLIEENNMNDVEKAIVEYHVDGRRHLILSALE